MLCCKKAAVILPQCPPKKPFSTVVIEVQTPCPLRVPVAAEGSEKLEPRESSPRSPRPGLKTYSFASIASTAMITPSIRSTRTTAAGDSMNLYDDGLMQSSDSHQECHETDLDGDGDSVIDAHSVSSVNSLFDDMDIEPSERRARIMSTTKAFTADGQLQMDAQRAVLRNEHLKIYILAEQYGFDGQLPGLITSNLLALALQEGCTIDTLTAVLDTGANASAHILLRSEKGDPVRAVYPLMFAVEREDKEVVKCLLRAGADPLQEDAKGLVPYVEAMKDNRNRSIFHLLHKYAVKIHGPDKLKTIIGSHRRTYSSSALKDDKDPLAGITRAPATVHTAHRRLGTTAEASARPASTRIEYPTHFAAVPPLASPPLGGSKLKPLPSPPMTSR